MIEDLMVAANQVTASLLEQKNVPSIRRVLKDPERWDRIAILASTLGGNLPSEPDAKSLEGFLNEHRRVNPDHFPDLSLSIIKLLGRGEYVLKSPGDSIAGTLWFSGTTLFTLHGAEQAISRFANTTSFEKGHWPAKPRFMGSGNLRASRSAVRKKRTMRIRWSV
jgi:hypothetical protein